MPSRLLFRSATLLLCTAVGASISGAVRADDPGTCPVQAPAVNCSSFTLDSFSSLDPSNLTTYSCGDPFAPVDQTGPDHQYAFECQTDGPVTIGLTAEDCDLDLYVLDSSCNSETGCLVGDTAGDTPTEVTFDCVAGQDYIVSVEGFGFTSGGAPRSCTDGDGYGLRVLEFGAGTGCPEHCQDFVDNDLDGKVDCEDSDCSGNAQCIAMCDMDGDGFYRPDPTCYGLDCDDLDPAINPAAQEICGNGVDENCDGFGLLSDDEDADGCSTGEEQALANPTDACDDDSDDDLLLDGTELGANCAVDTGETDPLVFDTDGDGLGDGLEVNAWASNPLDDDSDDDGLLDGSEDADADGNLDATETDPLSFDTDGDTLSDGLESGLAFPQGDDTDSTVFVADTDITSTTDPRDPDTDDDGRTDGAEDTDGNGATSFDETDPLDADSDDDGLADGAESASSDTDGDGSADALDADSDDDALVDGIEAGLVSGLSGGMSDVFGIPYSGTDGFAGDADPTTTTDPLTQDTDSDGLFDGIEDANFDGAFDPGETDPNDADTDDDLLLDGEEDSNANGAVDGTETDPRIFDTDADGAGDGAEEAVGSDPLDPDTDNDGLMDGAEGLGSPVDADSDDDGLSDGEEDADSDNTVDPFETAPNDFDTDNDGLGDGLESGVTVGVSGGVSGVRDLPYAGTEGNFVGDSDATTMTDPLAADTDGDELLDGDEDADGDGFVDATETDPNLFDTDGDGVGDGEELLCGSDPTDPSSTIDCVVFRDGFE